LRRRSLIQRLILAVESDSFPDITLVLDIPSKVFSILLAEVIDLDEERQAIFQNMEDDIIRLM
jgi:hypothetical protein